MAAAATPARVAATGIGWIAAEGWEGVLAEELRRAAVVSPAGLITVPGLVGWWPASADGPADPGRSGRGEAPGPGRMVGAIVSPAMPPETPSNQVAPGRAGGTPRWPVFARQALPNLVLVKAASVQDLATGIGRYLDPVLDAHGGTWHWWFGTADEYTDGGTCYRSIGSRAGLLAEVFAERMARFRRRAWERAQPWDGTPVSPDQVLVQAVLAAPNRLWLSIAAPMLERADLAAVVGDGQATGVATPTGHHAESVAIGAAIGPPSHPREEPPCPMMWPRPRPRALVCVGRPDQVPCRSFFKLEEALAEAGHAPRPGETCVDLGAAPGGWTWAALARGATVIAVDAADLAPHVATHPRCQHRRDNGYAFMPAQPVDWLFCDMIVRPMATLGLLERWLSARACRRFVVNVKYRGKDPFSILAAVDRLAATHHLASLVVRHLFHDRNELTLIGLC